MAQEIATERTPGVSPRRTAAGIFAFLFTCGIFAGVITACGDDDDYSPDPVDVGDARYNYDSSWHTIQIADKDGTMITCVVSDFKEGVWCGS